MLVSAARAEQRRESPDTVTAVSRVLEAGAVAKQKRQSEPMVDSSEKASLLANSGPVSS